MGVGATIDFLAGSVRRAPKWMQRSGLEWVFRLLQEPRRLFGRYFRDLWAFGYAILRQWWALRDLRNRVPRPERIVVQETKSGAFQIARLTGSLDAATVSQHADLWTALITNNAQVVFDLSEVEFIDSTGAGLLLRMNKHLRAQGRQLVLVAPTKKVLRALGLMRVENFFCIAPDLNAARVLVHERLSEANVVTSNRSGADASLAWQGDITAANEESVWRMTRLALCHSSGQDTVMNINLAGVRFIDSTGVRLMVRVRKEARHRGIQVRFTAPAPGVQNVLRVLRMERHLLD